MKFNKSHIMLFLILAIIYALKWHFIIEPNVFANNFLGLEFIINEKLEFANVSLFIFKSVILILIAYYLLLAIFNIKSPKLGMKYFTRFYVLTLAYFLIIKGIKLYFNFDLSPSVFQYASFRIENFIEFQELANLLLFIPLPIVVYNYTHNYIIMTLLFLLSPLVELIQLAFNIGAFDIMDIIFNTVGLIIGFIILFIINHKKKRLLPTIQDKM